jgi:hypothetical protein
MKPFNLDIVSIAILVIIVLALLFYWSISIKITYKNGEENKDLENVVTHFVHNPDNIIEHPRPYSDETHFYFKGNHIPTIAKGNYLPLIPVVIEGTQMLRITTKYGYQGIIKLIELESAIYYPNETNAIKNSSNG